MNTFIALGFAIAVLVVAVVAIRRHERRALDLRIGRRQSFSDAELIEAFEISPQDANRFIELMSFVSSELGVDRGFLRPSDRLDNELASVEGSEFDSGQSALVFELKKRLADKGRVVSKPLESLSLQEYIRELIIVY